MTWSERMKKAIDTFKRMALPLYLFYFLFSLIGVIMAVVTFGLFLMPNLRAGGFGSAFPVMPYMSPDTPYMDPSIPVPPGYNPSMEFGPSMEYGLFNELAPYLDMVPQFIGLFLVMLLISWFLISFFLTGVFHLTRKAYVEKAKFGDIKFKGFPRIMGWHLIITLIGIILISIGVFIAISITSEYAIALFSIIYILVLMAIGLFLAPWVFAAPYFMLNRPQLPFGQSFKSSWSFYRRHMGLLWAGFLTVVGIQLLINMISRNAPDLGLFINFVISPFLAILPIIWVLTLEEEELPLAIDNLYANTSQVSPYPQSQAPPTDSFSSSRSFAPASPSGMSESNPIDASSSNSTPSETPISSSPPSNTPPDNSSNPPNEPYSPPMDPYTPPKEPYTPPNYPYTTSELQTDSPFIVPTPDPNTSGDADDYPINFCPTCGKKVREKASYCSQCGTKL